MTSEAPPRYSGVAALVPIGDWHKDADSLVAFEAEALMRPASQIRETIHVVRDGPHGRIGVALNGSARLFKPGSVGDATGLPLLAILPPLYPEWLGDRSFGETHGARFPYIGGEMANGIASSEMVVALANAGMMGFFGAAGLPLDAVRRAIIAMRQALGDSRAWGVNIIHSPNEPGAEDALADLLIREGAPCVSASAFMTMTPAIVRCAAAGLSVDSHGNIVRARQVFAKVSRLEVAEKFMAPPPPSMLQGLVASGRITAAEADLAARLPVAEDVTAEADSGGHTDNRPLSVLIPAMAELRDKMMAKHLAYPRIRIGAAGGLGTPTAVAGAFALGADYVVTGSINQSAIEADVSPEAKTMLAGAGFADVAMAPSADMFELGVKVQVLKRGTMFAARASRLYEIYQRYDSLDAIPAETRTRLETEIFRKSLDAAWAETEAFWASRDPHELAKARKDPRHAMALTFRSYLGLASRWAKGQNADRQSDFQLWCGPAMGAFNAWTSGTFLADPARRTVAQIGLNLLEGAAVISRVQQLRTYGVAVGSNAFSFVPRPLI